MRSIDCEARRRARVSAGRRWRAGRVLACKAVCQLDRLNRQVLSLRGGNEVGPDGLCVFTA